MMISGRHIGRRLRFGALAAPGLAVVLCFVAGTGGVGYAVDPISSASSSASSSSYLVMTADSLDAVGLAYVGMVSVPGPSGSVQVLRFTMTSGSVAGVSFTQACTDGRTTVTSAPSATLGSTTFDAVSLAVTVGGTPLTFTITSPPTSAFPSEIVLQDVTLSATTVTADKLSAPSFSTQAASCPVS